MKNIIFFDQINVGGKFQTPSKIIYQKISEKECIPLFTGDEQEITQKRKTIAFYNSKLPLVSV